MKFIKKSYKETKFNFSEAYPDSDELRDSIIWSIKHKYELRKYGENGRKMFLDDKNYFEDKNCIKSYDVGIRKPDKNVYKISKDLLGDVDEIIYIDDVQEYIDFANSLGITAIKYDCRFDKIKELIQKIKELEEKLNSKDLCNSSFYKNSSKNGLLN